MAWSLPSTAGSGDFRRSRQRERDVHDRVSLTRSTYSPLSNGTLALPLPAERLVTSTDRIAERSHDRELLEPAPRSCRTLAATRVRCGQCGAVPAQPNRPTAAALGGASGRDGGGPGLSFGGWPRPCAFQVRSGTARCAQGGSTRVEFHGCSLLGLPRSAVARPIAGVTNT
jgi:hypothetical protein